MIRNRTTTISQPAMGRAIGAAAALMMLAGTTPETLAETEVSAGEVSDDNRCITFTVTRDDETDTPVRDLHFAKGSLPENFDDLTVTVKSGDEELDGWVVDVRNGKVNVYSPDGEVPVGDVTIKLTIPDAAAGEKQHEWGTKNSAKTKLYTTEDGDHLTSNDQTNDTLTDHGKNARLAATVASVAPTRPGELFLSPATDPVVLEPGASVSCAYTGAPQTTSPTSWWRSYHLAELGVDGAFVATEVIIPIERAFHPEGSQAFTVRLYLDPSGGAPVPDELELLGAAGIGVNNTELTSVSIPLAGRVPAGGTLVMQVESDDGSAPAAPGTLLGGVFLIGGNTLDQSSPSYISSADCGILEPVDMATQGFELSLAMSVAGYEEVRCYADLDGDGSLTIFDFLEFQNLFVAGDPLADCDGSGSLTIFDFLCFQNAFVAGCPGQAVTVDRVRPGEVVPGAELTIVGSGFDPDPQNNRVVLGADEAGHGGVVAEVLRASPGEMVVRVPDVVGAVSGESAVVFVGETFDVPPFEGPAFGLVEVGGFEISTGAGMGVGLLVFVIDPSAVSEESSDTGSPQCWEVKGDPAEGDKLKITITYELDEGRKKTYIFPAEGEHEYDGTETAAEIGQEIADWINTLDGLEDSAEYDEDECKITFKSKVKPTITIKVTSAEHSIKPPAD